MTQSNKTTKIIIAVLIVVAVVIAVLFSKSSSPILMSEVSFEGAEVRVPETSDLYVTLDQTTKNPANNYPMGVYDAGSIVVLADKSIQLEDGRIIAPFAHSTSGSDEYLYLGLFDVDLKSASSYPIGSRVLVDSISMEDTIVTVEYLTHGEGQSMSEAPNTPATLIVEVNANLLVKRISS